MNKETKQVIVMRMKYPDSKGGVKKISIGKEFAQIAHSSISFITRRMKKNGKEYRIQLSQAEQEWIESGFTKVCLQVDTEEELLGIYNKAKENGIEVHLITDAGRTEFGGIPTRTCLALGPDYSEKIDKITGDLKLL